MSLRAPIPSDARSHLAKSAALLRHHPDAVDRIEAERRSAKFVTLADYITKIVDSAPPLTTEQRDRLALLLRGGAASDAA